MSLNLSRKGLVFVVVGLFLASSFSTVIGLGANQISSSSDNMDSEDSSPQEATLHLVSAIDVDEDLDERYPWNYDHHPRNHSFPSLLVEDMNVGLHEESYPSYFRHHLMNHSEYPFDEPFFGYHDYDEFEDIYPDRFTNEYVKNHTLKNRKPSSKPNFADGKTWYVDDDGGQDFTRIQDAIDAASEGDTIFVYSGVYYENVVVNKSIKLVGEDRDTTIIDGFRGKNIGILSYSIEIVKDSVNISDFTVRQGFFGIYISSNDNVLSRNHISNNHLGIFLYESSGNRITENKVTNNDGVGIYIQEDSSNNVILENTITYNDNDGVNLWHSSDHNLLKGNIIANNTYSGISIQSSSNNSFTENILENNKGGISLAGSHFNVILRNTITNNYGFGIALCGSSYVNITDNNFVSDGILIIGSIVDWISHTIEDNFANGKPIYYYKNNHEGMTVPYDAAQVILANCSNFVLKNLNITNVDNGVQLGFSSDNDIQNNRITNNDDVGIYLSVSSNNSIAGNNIISNNENGIHLYVSTNNFIINNNISRNNGGISLFYLGPCGYNVISGNNISNNNGVGIYLYHSADNNSITGNIITRNKEDGIVLYMSSGNSISGNTITNNSWDGIEISCSSGNSISGNTITNNTANGIALYDSSFNSPGNNAIEENTITNNTANGIYLSRSNSNQIKDNYCTSNHINGIRLILYSSNNVILYCTIQDHFLSGIVIEDDSSDNIIQNCNISQNWRGIEIDSDSTFNKITDCFINSNYWGIKLSDSRFNRIEKCTIGDNYCGIMRGKQNVIRRNNFIDNKIFDALGELQHKNFWFRNYYNGHNTPLPYYLYGLNFDWFPRARPYDYPAGCDISTENPDGTWGDWNDGILQERDFEELDSHFNLKDRILESLSSLDLRERDVLNDDIPRLLNEHELFNPSDTREYLMNLWRSYVE